MIEVFARLTEEDLNQWRVVSARHDLIEAGVNGISPAEAERYVIDYYRALGRFASDYNLPVDNFAVSPINGCIFVTTPDE